MKFLVKSHTCTSYIFHHVIIYTLMFWTILCRQAESERDIPTFTYRIIHFSTMQTGRNYSIFTYFNVLKKI